MNKTRITLPVTEDQILGLKAGDFVLLSGTVYGMRDAAHSRIDRLIKGKKELPFTLSGSAIYYVGPTPSPKKEYVFGAAGPTTSDRMDKYTPRLLSKGVKILIGKGSRSSRVVQALKKNRAVYLATIGGAGSYLAGRITYSTTIAFDDLGPEAVRKMTVQDFPCIVINDAYGNDFYKGKKSKRGS